MASIPLWLTGRFVTSVTARTQIPDSAGLLGNGTGTVQTLTGLVDEIDINGETLVQSVVPLTSTREHYVGYLIDDSITIREIMQSPQAGNLLSKLWYNADNADHVLLSFTRGGNTWAGYFVMVDYNENIARPKSVAELTVRMVNLSNSVANPSYA